MSDERPEALLRSALEKIVYFEARSKQLENDVTATRAEVDRLKAELAQAAQRELELRRHVAGVEVDLSRAHRERDELARMNDALKAERTNVLQQLIEASQIQNADAGEEMQIDLAAFISQLRSEALNVTQAREVAKPAAASLPVPAPSAPVVTDEELSFEFASMQGYPGAVPTLTPSRSAPNTSAYAFDETASAGGAAETAYASARASARSDAPVTAYAEAPAFAAYGELDAKTPYAGRVMASSSASSSRSAVAAIATVAPTGLGATPANASIASRVSAHAERLLAEGRLKVSRDDVEKLSAASTFPGRTEETLFGFSIRELSAPDAAARARAAERLRALGQSAAAPALAGALHAEREAIAQVAMLSAFSELAEKEGVAVVMPLLDAPSPDVRVAALKALLELDAMQAGPHLSAAMKDADRAVRRRASLLALGLEGASARALGEQAVHDADAEVRALGALVLGAGGGEHARSLLLTALRDPEKKVRKAAAQSLSRILGEDLSAVVDLDEPQRRREVRRLATVTPREWVRAKAPEVARAPVRAVDVPASTVVNTAPRSDVASTVVNTAAPTRQPTTVVEAAFHDAGRSTHDGPKPAPATEEALTSALANELRISIRGRTVAELSSITDAPPPSVVDACELLVARGQAVKRGTKFFAA